MKTALKRLLPGQATARRRVAAQVPRVLAVAAGAALCVSGCGASIQAIYEGDVRFERCMAMDARAEVAANLRRTCWMEWISFYTYGQTRDRVVHAQLRIQQLQDGRAPRGGLRVDPSPAGTGRDGAGNPSPQPQLGKSSSDLTDGARVQACQHDCHTVHLECLAACDDHRGTSRHASSHANGSCAPGCEAGLRSCHDFCR